MCDKASDNEIEIKAIRKEFRISSKNKIGLLKMPGIYHGSKHVTLPCISTDLQKYFKYASGSRFWSLEKDEIFRVQGRD
jgi:hypothetical protein